MLEGSRTARGWLRMGTQSPNSGGWPGEPGRDDGRDGRLVTYKGIGQVDIIRKMGAREG